MQAHNDLSENAYAGACPPHRYVFTVFAIRDAVVPLDKRASATLIGFFADAGALDRATLFATYGR